MKSPHEVLHNNLVRPALEAIVKPVVENGGTMSDVFVLTESVLSGILAFGNLNGYDPEKILDAMVERIKKERLPEMRKKGN